MGYNSWPGASMEERPQERGTETDSLPSSIMIEDECNDSPHGNLIRKVKLWLHRNLGLQALAHMEKGK